jgi:type II secretory pathway pseudopilin PulG
MLIELLIALTFITVAIGALMSVYSSSVVTMRHASIEGNALTLVDKQMELLKTMSYASVALNTSTIPASTDLYATSPPSNLTTAQKAAITSGQVPNGNLSAAQTVTGPDSRTYRVDTYIFETSTTSGYASYLQATVAVRLVTSGTVGTIRAQATSAINDASTHA